jgi:hypothetical protein
MAKSYFLDSLLRVVLICVCASCVCAAVVGGCFFDAAAKEAKKAITGEITIL